MQGLLRFVMIVAGTALLLAGTMALPGLVLQMTLPPTDGTVVLGLLSRVAIATLNWSVRLLPFLVVAAALVQLVAAWLRQSGWGGVGLLRSNTLAAGIVCGGVLTIALAVAVLLAPLKQLPDTLLSEVMGALAAWVLLAPASALAAMLVGRLLRPQALPEIGSEAPLPLPTPAARAAAVRRGSLIVAVLVVLGVLVVQHRQYREEQEAIEQRIELLQKDVRVLEVTAAHLTEFKAEVATLEVRLGTLRQAVPVDLGVDSIVTSLRGVARDLGVTIDGWRVSEMPKGPVRQARIGLRLRGSAEAVEKLALQTTRMQRLAVWETPAPDDPSMAFVSIYAMPAAPPAVASDSCQPRPSQLWLWPYTASTRLQQGRVDSLCSRLTELAKIREHVDALERQRREYMALVNFTEAINASRADTPARLASSHRPGGPASTPDRDPGSPRAIRIPAGTSSGGGPLHIALRGVDLADVFLVLHELTGEGFVVGDQRQAVDLDVQGATVPEVVAAAQALGAHVSRLGPAGAAGTAGGKSIGMVRKRAEMREVLALVAGATGRPVLAPAGDLGRVSVFRGETAWDGLLSGVIEVAGLEKREEGSRILVERRGNAGVPLAAIDAVPSTIHSLAETELADLALSGLGTSGAAWVAFAYRPEGTLAAYRVGGRLSGTSAWSEQRRAPAIRAVSASGMDVELVRKWSDWSGTGGEEMLTLRFTLPDALPTITLGEKTTVVTTPLLPEGTPDYAAVLNARHGSGVRPEDNAAGPLLLALGGHRNRDALRRLGIDPDTATDPGLRGGQGDLALFEEHLRALAADGKGPGMPTDLAGTFARDWTRASKGPWTEAANPLIAEWLRINEKPLAGIAAAVRRPRYYVPIAEGGPLWQQQIPSLLPFRNAGNAFRARTLLRLGQGDDGGAVADAVAGQRLAFTVGQDATLIAHLIAVALRGIASEALPVVAASPRLSAPAAAELARDLAELPPLPGMAEVFDEGERFHALDRVCWMRTAGARRGPGAWLPAHEDSWLWNRLTPSRLYQIPASAIDWDEVLRLTNRAWDNLVAEARARTEAERRDARTRREQEAAWTAEAERALAEPRLRVRLTAWVGRMIGREDWDPTSRAALTRAIAALAVAQAGILRAAVSWNEAEAQFRLGVVALALARHRLESGGFPPRLEDLAPKYLAPDSAQVVTANGYRFHYHPGPGRTSGGAASSFTYTAVPETTNETGVRGFCVDGAGHSATTRDGSEPPTSGGRCPEDQPKGRQ